jgi:hypothetical protein
MEKDSALRERKDMETNKTTRVNREEITLEGVNIFCFNRFSLTSYYLILYCSSAGFPPH